MRWTGFGTHTGADLMQFPANGKVVTAHGVYVLRFENGKIAEVWNHWDSLTLLEDTYGRIRRSMAGLPAGSLNAPSPDKAWSPIQILAHLRACSDVWTHTLYAMLAEERPNLALFDLRRWAKAAGYASLDFERSLLQTFELQRDELVRLLRALPVEAWERAATIEGRTRTVFSQARRMALHEVEHCEQLERMAKGAKVGDHSRRH
jgi:hypothetical protein